MLFVSSGIYHVYNQGNNRQKIFFCRSNYLYFNQKIRHHVVPYADVLAYCLMPNHFHLMLYVNFVSLDRVNSTHPVKGKTVTLNTSIGIMLRSYTRAINNQEKRTGALFREETKAICLNEPMEISPSWFVSNGSAIMSVEIEQFQYTHTCFRYIHANPVRAGLVLQPENWEFSSCAELNSPRKKDLVNRKKVRELGLLTP